MKCFFATECKYQGRMVRNQLNEAVEMLFPFYDEDIFAKVLLQPKRPCLHAAALQK